MSMGCDQAVMAFSLYSVDRPCTAAAPTYTTLHTVVMGSESPRTLLSAILTRQMQMASEMSRTPFLCDWLYFRDGNINFAPIKINIVLA